MNRLDIGTTIDGFTLTQRMPSGGMASLWRATHDAHPGPIVLKIPTLEPGQDASIIIGYEVEELILKRVSGRHVPRLLATGDLAATPYLAMEFVAGEGLARIAERGALPADEVARIGAQIAVALADIHRQGAVHLDLKPQNIILAPHGAVLLDFGLARHVELPDLLGEESDVPMGTAAYISPEQVLGERSDMASDIFALGCILYQLATGEEPYGRPSTVAGMKRRLYHAPKPMRAIDPRLPAWLEQIVSRCMEVDRGRRYADAGKVLFDLRHPEQVVLARPRRRERTLLQRLVALFQKKDERELVGRPTQPARRAGPSLILVAVDLSEGPGDLAEAVLAETARLLAARPDSWLACLTVLKTEIIRETALADETGQLVYVKRLVALRDWAHPLHLPDERISFHVLEAVGAADAILRYAEHNDIDHIVIGARSSSAMRRHLGSVSTKVVAEARCSVSVVRLKGPREAPA
ncbi:MAG: protein kinase domain-containing protein [Bosea sp. (in: a-proteobacteria)]